MHHAGVDQAMFRGGAGMRALLGDYLFEQWDVGAVGQR